MDMPTQFPNLEQVTTIVSWRLKPLLFQSIGLTPTDNSRQNREKRPRQDLRRRGSQGHLAEDEELEGGT